MAQYRTPGVYVEEIRLFPPSIVAVETAIPVFIGYTEFARDRDLSDLQPRNKPRKIGSLLEYVRYFGRPMPETGITVTIVPATATDPPQVRAAIDPLQRKPYWMYYAVQHFFANGGGDCYIVSVGDYSTGTVGEAELLAGLTASEVVDEITLILFPDAQNVTSAANYNGLYNAAMLLCQRLQDRFTIMDVWLADQNDREFNQIDIDGLRGAGLDVNIDVIKYGAAYYPNLETTLDYWYGGEGDGDANVQVVNSGAFDGALSDLRGKQDGNAMYFRARQAIRDLGLNLPPSPAIAGVYASVDETRGVWKAPANVNIAQVIKPLVEISDRIQDGLNIDSNSGKSVNCIRSFTGRGNAIVWGARTLAGNDNEWRYISVRRFFNMVEESVREATAVFVFEPNDRNTWVRVKGMIENFLILQWRAGALAGAVPEHAFFVKVGLGETMTAQDILEGYMHVEIGMAVVRPAEFIVLKFSHKMQES